MIFPALMCYIYLPYKYTLLMHKYTFPFLEAYMSDIKFIDGGVCAPKGFTANGTRIWIKESRKINAMALVYSEVPCNAAGVFTQNRVQSESVKISKNPLPMVGLRLHLELKPISRTFFTWYKNYLLIQGLYCFNIKSSYFRNIIAFLCNFWKLQKDYIQSSCKFVTTFISKTVVV